VEIGSRKSKNKREMGRMGGKGREIKKGGWGNRSKGERKGGTVLGRE